MELFGSPSHANGSPRALTLVEMLIVLVIVAIIAAVAFPGGGDQNMQRLRAAASIVIADLDYARLQSIGNGADPCVVVFDSALPQYHLARRSDPQAAIRDPGTNRLYITRFGGTRALAIDGVIIDSLDVGGDLELGFTAFGAIDQGADAGLTLRCGDETIAITINASTGEAAVQ